MWTCVVCENTQAAGDRCSRCGFDRRLDFTAHRTLCPVSVPDVEQLLARRALWRKQHPAKPVVEAVPEQKQAPQPQAAPVAAPGKDGSYRIKKPGLKQAQNGSYRWKKPSSIPSTAWQQPDPISPSPVAGSGQADAQAAHAPSPAAQAQPAPKTVPGAEGNAKHVRGAEKAPSQVPPQTPPKAEPQVPPKAPSQTPPQAPPQTPPQVPKGPAVGTAVPAPAKETFLQRKGRPSKVGLAVLACNTLLHLLSIVGAGVVAPLFGIVLVYFGLVTKKRWCFMAILGTLLCSYGAALGLGGAGIALALANVIWTIVYALARKERW